MIGSDAFNKAFDFTIKHEGGYANNPNDYGGETIAGISRVYWPNWSGWKKVDASRKSSDFPSVLYSDKALLDDVKSFYHTYFWSPIKGDDLAAGSIDIAVEAFDAGVNMGTGRSAKFIQEGLNIFNRNGSLYSELAVDGAIGSGTIGAYNTFLRTDDPELLLKALLIQRGSHYGKLAIRDASQETFIRGWLNRLIIDKGIV